MHAIDEIEKIHKVDVVVFLQATSPLREPSDLDKSVEIFFSECADSLFSAAVLEDFCVWENDRGNLKSVTFDYKNRVRRQDRKPYYLENGSIYIFKPEIIRQYNNRLGGKIVFYPMPLWKSYEIDDYDTLEICEYFIMNKILKQNKENPCRNIQ
ncbi:MAG: acylneuraminate cytidylyltransferase family protein, partial [Bacteroidota bacterium]